MQWWKFLLPLATLFILVGISVFLYMFMKQLDDNELNNYIEVQCTRKKNATIFEVRGGSTVFFSLHKLVDIENSTTPGDLWHNFATDVTKSSGWRYIGSGILQDFDRNGLRMWSEQKNITPTERDAKTNKRIPVRYDRNRYLVITENFPNRTSVGFDYYSDPQRNDMVMRAKRSKNITASDPAQAINTPDKTLIFFIPLYNDTTQEFIGGVSGAYYIRNMTPVAVPDNDVSIRLMINNIVGYQDKEYSQQAPLLSQKPFEIADQKALMQCSSDKASSTTPLIFLIIGSVTGVILGIMVLALLLSNEKKHKATLKKLEIEKQQALVDERAEDAMRSAKSKSEFLFNMSHEIRTPINGILWMIDFLLNTPMTTDQKEYAETVKISSQSLLGIINDILDISKMEAGKLDIEMISVNIVHLLEQLYSTYQSIAKKNNNTFQLEIADNVKDKNAFVTTDPTRVSQIINNLVNNALKFTKNGIVKLECFREITDDIAATSSSVHNIAATSSSQQLQPQGKLWFEIRDTGMGMTEEQIGKLFKQFSQATSSIARQYGGTGLGLTICKNLVMLMKGDIGVRSEPGKGSVFWFWLPYIPADPIVEKIAKEKKRFKGNVLVAEDNLVNQKVIYKLLAGLYGLTVTMVDDGQKVLDMLDQGNKYDCIFMDGVMPVMDGYESTRRLREKGYTLPVIAFTASAMKGEKERCIECGMNDFLSKPIVKEELSRVLSEIPWGENAEENSNPV